MNFDFSNALIKQEEYEYLKPFAKLAQEMLELRKFQGNDYTGWLDYTSKLSKDEIEKIKRVAKTINDKADTLIVIGIGGSYLGSKTVIEALTPTFAKTKTRVLYAGHQLSQRYLSELLEEIKTSEVCINVISKSGTTTEPAVAFRILKKALEEKYGIEEAKKRIVATTDEKRGALRTLADAQGYETFVIPDDVGGRYSVITPVGLLPIAVAGIDIEQFISGIIEGEVEYSKPNVDENDAARYAIVRNVLLRKGRSIEALVNYEPKLAFLAEWWMQLYGESEGKDLKGIYPAKLSYTTDLHSMGQMIQDGPRSMFETILNLEDAGEDLLIPSESQDLDGLEYLAGKPVSFVNDAAFRGTLEAHLEGNVPNLIINIKKLDAHSIGKLMYFFMKACGISGYMLGVNPFDQPGVEAYKKNMFRILGKK